MARFIVQFGDKFLEWSTVVDAPVSTLMTESELRKFMVAEYGETILNTFEYRMARVKEYTTSAMSGITKQDLLECNRAGRNGERVSREADMIALYKNAGDN